MANPARVITVAGKFSSSFWENYYYNFVMALKAFFNVDAYVAPSRNWHAKIAIRLDAMGEPIVGLVGSSNLTRPAYGIMSVNWNFEADVLIWTPDSERDKIFGRPYEVDNNEALLGDFHLVLDTRKDQYSEQYQLYKLHKYVMESGLERFNV